MPLVALFSLNVDRNEMECHYFISLHFFPAIKWCCVSCYVSYNYCRITNPFWCDSTTANTVQIREWEMLAGQSFTVIEVLCSKKNIVLKTPSFHEAERVKQRCQYLFIFTHRICSSAGVWPSSLPRLRSDCSGKCLVGILRWKRCW